MKLDRSRRMRWALEGRTAGLVFVAAALVASSAYAFYGAWPTGGTASPLVQVSTPPDQGQASLHKPTLVEGVKILSMIADLPSGDDVLVANDVIVPPSILADPDRTGADSGSWDERYVRVAKELQKYDDESILFLFQMFIDSHPRFAPPGSHAEEDRRGAAYRGRADTKLFLLNRLIYEPQTRDAPSPTFWVFTTTLHLDTGRHNVEYMFPLAEAEDGKFSIRKDFSGSMVSLHHDRPIEELKFFAEEFPRRQFSGGSDTVSADEGMGVSG